LVNPGNQGQAVSGLLLNSVFPDDIEILLGTGKFQGIVLSVQYSRSQYQTQ